MCHATPHETDSRSIEESKSVKASAVKKQRHASASVASGSAGDKNKLNEQSLGNLPKVNADVEKELQKEKTNYNK